MNLEKELKEVKAKPDLIQSKSEKEKEKEIDQAPHERLHYNTKPKTVLVDQRKAEYIYEEYETTIGGKTVKATRRVRTVIKEYVSIFVAN